jgi:hypothetical protein
MSTATVFKPGGHFHDTGDRFLDRRPRGRQNAATRPDVQATITAGEISGYGLKSRVPGAEPDAALNRLVESRQLVAGDRPNPGHEPLRTFRVSSLAQPAGGGP